MIEFTPEAREKALFYLHQQSIPDQVLRIAVKGRTAKGYDYAVFLDQLSHQTKDDVVVDLKDFKILIDSGSANILRGSRVDWVESKEGAGFQFSNPNQIRLDMNDPKVQTIQNLLDKEINPGVGLHGGFIELVGVEGDKVLLRMQGGCQGCGNAIVTLKEGIEIRIKEIVPEIREIVDVTDHMSGTNPYYT